MNERKLKNLFINSVNSGHVRYKGEVFFPISHENSEIKIKDEAYFRNFDLVIAIVHKNFSSSRICYPTSLDNLYMRSSQLSQFARDEKCRIDSISFYPVEIKSDNDVLDQRLPNQILNATLTFGRSIIVLDKKYFKNRRRNSALRLLPATIIGYTGKEDNFEVISIFDRFVESSILNLPKRKFAKTLFENGLVDNTEKLYRRLSILQLINQKFVFNLFNEESIQLADDEREFLREFSNFSGTVSDTKQIKKLMKDNIDYKITDF